MPVLILLPLALIFLALAGYYGAHVTLSGGNPLALKVRPEQFGLPYEKVQFETRDGLTLSGWFLPAAQPSGRTVLFCHGWGANKGEVLKDTFPLRERGLNLFYFDFRSCGESEGRVLSVGTLEALDFDAAVDFIQSYRPNDSLGVYGISMGSLVVFAGLTRHKDLKAAILENAYTAHWQALYQYLKAKYGVIFISIFPFILLWMRWKLGVDMEARNPTRLARLLRNTPILVISGERDPIATPEIGQSLFNLIEGPKELWIVPGAGHTLCSQTAGPAYTDKVAQFYDKNL